MQTFDMLRFMLLVAALALIGMTVSKARQLYNKSLEEEKRNERRG